MKTTKLFRHTRLILSFILGFIWAHSVQASVQIGIVGSTTVTSIATGSQFIYTLDYQCSSLTSNGQNVTAQIQLPTYLTPYDETNFSNSVSYDESQVASVSYTISTHIVQIVFVNPLPAGSTGQMQFRFKYESGLTPNGYAPNLFTSMDASNNLNSDSTTGPVYSDTLNIIALASNRFTVSKHLDAGGAIDDMAIYAISIGSGGGIGGPLQLSNPIFRDTLAGGLEFLEATAFSGSNTPIYDSISRIITWTWPSGTILNPGWSSSVYVSVKVHSPTYSIGSTLCNSASLTGDIPALPIGTSSTSQVSGQYCFAVQAPAPAAGCSGGSITTATADWLNHHVLAGTTCNTFHNGWYNAGNTKLDSIQLTYDVDKNIDMNEIRIRPLYDGFNRVTEAGIEVIYSTNLHSGISAGTYMSTNIAGMSGGIKKITISLGGSEYITHVQFIIRGDLPIGCSQDFSYCGDIRTASQGAKDGSAIIEGTTYNPSNIGDDGTVIYNTSSGSAFAGGTTYTYSSCNGNAEILHPQPVWGYTSKSILNSSTSLRASDTINYVFHTYLGGNVDATNVIVTDTLDSKLTYINGSSVFYKGNTSSVITPTINGNIIQWNIGTLQPGYNYYIHFDAEIVPGTAPGTIDNKAWLQSSNSLLDGSTGIATATVISAVALRAYKGQSGCDPSYVFYPSNAVAQEGGPVNYKITVKNLGNVASKNLVLVDVFPFIGDYRGSEWFANLVGPVSINNPSSTVYYTTTNNPCYSDFNPSSSPTGCNAPSWTTTAPIDITSVKAIKITRNATLNALDSIVLTWPMKAPVGTPQGKLMNNSIMYQANRADNNSQLLPSTPQMVGFYTNCIPVLGSLGDYVWIDVNKNGLQDEASTLGLNGVKIYLYQAGADHAIGGGDDVLVDSTVSADDFYHNPGYYKFVELASGYYYVRFETSFNQYLLTKTNNQSAQTNGNNDADYTTGYSEVVLINASGSGQDKDNTTIDAGYYPTGTLGNFVWIDANKNGLQDDGNSSGVNGISVYLWKDDGSGTYQSVDSTVTLDDISGNPGYYQFVLEESGNYKVQFPKTYNYKVITTQNSNAGIDGNSDANSTTGYSPVITMNLMGTGVSKNNPTIDCGFRCNVSAGSSAITSSYNGAYLSCHSSSDGTITASGSGGDANYIYKIDGGSYAVSNVFNGLSSGNHTVYVKDGTGCIDTKTITITAPSSINPNASSVTSNYHGAQISCNGNNDATITASATGGTGTYQYKIDTGSYGNSYIFNGLAAGTHTVYIKDLNGCIANKNITVSQPSSLHINSATVTSDYNGSQLSCFGGSDGQITVSASGGTGSLSYAVDSSSYQNAAVLNHLSAGTHIIYVKDANNCVASTSVSITPPAPFVSTASNNGPVCIGKTITLNGHMSGGTGTITYVWSGPHGFTANTASPTLTTNADTSLRGTYAVVITDINGCTANPSTTVQIYDQPICQFTINNNAQCLRGNNFEFTNGSTVPGGGSLTYDWDFGDGTSHLPWTSPNHTYAAAGTYTVKLKVTTIHGCIDSITQTVIVYPNPVMHYTNSTGCASRINFTNSSSISSGSITQYIWNFGDGDSISTQIHPYRSFPGNGGPFTIALTGISNYGCRDTFTTTQSFTPSVDADFTTPSFKQCIDGNVFIFNNSQANHHPAWNTHSYWDFGDGTSSTNTFPNNKTYAHAGNYVVTLIVYSTNGCNDTIQHTVIVSPKPLAAFQHSALNCTKSVQFTNQSALSGHPLSYRWDFGDGQSATETNPTHTYSTAGNYLVKLVTSADGACSDSVMQFVHISDVVNPEFSVGTLSATCTGILQFTNQSSGAYGNVSFMWDFDDGTNATETNPRKIYQTVGDYYVRLTTTTENGCSNTITHQVHGTPGTPAPNANFDFTSAVCKGKMFVHNTTSGTGNTYTWNLGDGTFSNDIEPKKYYLNPGTYAVTLIATGSNGCKDSITKTYSMGSNDMNLIADFNINNINQCLHGNSFHCEHTSTNISDPSYSNGFLWDFGDGYTSTNNFVSPHTYTLAGDYTIRLIVFASNGCNDTAYKTVHVGAGPSVGFSFTNAHCSQSVQFNDSSSIGSSETLLYTWKFGDGTTSNISNPLHVFSPGTYTTKLIVTGSRGCSDSIQKTIEIGINPNAGFSYQAIANCTNNIRFINQTATHGSASTSYDWDFGDGTHSSQINPAKAYASTGDYLVTLIATSASQCSDTISVNIHANAGIPAPIPSFNITSGNTCNSKLTITNTTAGTGNSYVWNFGDGNSSSNIHPTHYYNATGTYSIQLTSIGSNGCRDSLIQTYTVQSVRLKADFSINNTEQCLNNNAFIYTYAAANMHPAWNTHALWDFGDGSNSENTYPNTKTYSSEGTYNVRLIVYSSNGCNDTTAKQVVVDHTFCSRLNNNNNGGINNDQRMQSANQSMESTGIKNNSETSLNVYPNPNQGLFRIQYPSNNSKATEIRIMNLLGQEVYREKFGIGFTSQDIQVDNIRDGKYVVFIYQDGIPLAHKQIEIIRN